MSGPPGGNDLDQEAQAQLKLLKLDHFTANPSTIEPFTASELSWQVTAQKEFFNDVGGTILLDGGPVAPADTTLVTPAYTQTYTLSAKALRYSRTLGDVTVQVDVSQCFTPPPADSVPATIETNIKYMLTMDPNRDTSLYLEPVTPATGPALGVWITPDRLNILMRIGKRMQYTDPEIDINASFGIQVVPGPVKYVVHLGRPIVAPGTPVIVATDVSIDVQVKVDNWVWLIPGAMIFLPIEIQNAKDKATKMVSDDIITPVVALLNQWFAPLQPPRTYLHDARLYIQAGGQQAGSQMFSVTYCPQPIPLEQP